MDVFTRNAQKSTHFVRADAKFTRENVQEQTCKVKETNTVAEVSFPTPAPASSSSETSIALRKRCYEKTNRQVKIEEDEPRKNKHSSWASWNFSFGQFEKVIESFYLHLNLHIE